MSKVIKKNLNQNFTKIMCDLKMAHAVKYLESTHMKIHEIAAGVGYETVDHFSRAFKKKFGLSPQEYRKKVLVSHSPALPTHLSPQSPDADD